MQRRITKLGPKKTEQIVERIRALDSAKEVAFALGIKVNSVYRVLKDRGYRPTYLTEAERDAISQFRNPSP